MTEICSVVPLILRESEHRSVGAGKLRKAEQVCRPRFADIVYAGDAEPHMTIFFHKKEVVIIMLSVEEEAVVGKEPEPPRQLRDFRTLDLPCSEGAAVLSGRRAALL